MALLPLLDTFDPRLREVADPVEKVDGAVRTIMNDLMETMTHVDGVGLAAPQVGIKKRIIAVDVRGWADDIDKPFLMANPILEWTSEETQVVQEGCFSVPGAYENVTRPLEIKVSYLDENNTPQRLHAQGPLADCIQHEIDHLNGILFIDHLSPLKQEMILRKVRKIKRLNG